MTVVIAKVLVTDLEEGFSELLKQNEGVVDSLLSDIASYIRDDAKTASSFIDRTGNLRKSIRKRKSKFIRGGYVVSATGKNNSEDKGYHAHLVEFGHEKVLWGKRTNERVPPHPFMRPAKDKGSVFAANKIRELGSK